MQIYIVRFLFLIFCLISFALPAQKLPVDIISGKIYFAEEVLVKDAPQTDLYNRAKAWFNRAENSKSILIKGDPENGLLILNSFFNLTTRQEEKSATFKIKYIIKIEVADDIYWYSIYNFRWQELSKSGKLNNNQQTLESIPLEEILFTNKWLEQKKEFYNLVECDLHNKLINYINSLKTSLL